MPKLCEGITDAHWDPQRIIQLKKIVNNFCERASTAQMDETLSGINASLIAAIALSYLYVGDPLQAMLLLGLESLEKDPFREGMSEIEKALKLYQVANDANNSILKRIEPHVKNWQNSACNFSGDSVHILMVDDFSNYNKTMESEGKIITLSGVVRERPLDVEEDRITLNNRVVMEQGSLYYSLLDGITAGKQISGLPDAVRNRHYSFQFSVSEKDAQLFGNSIGAGVGGLAYTLLLNRYYRAQVSGIGSSTAITGCLQRNGKITSVDSSGLKGKLKAAFFSPLTRVAVPEDNLEEAVHYVNTLKEQYPNRHLVIDGIDSLARTVQDRNLLDRKKITAFKKSSAAAKRIPKHYYFMFGSLILFCIFAFFFIFAIFPFSRMGQPANCQIEGNELRIFDENHKFLWSKKFDTELSKNSYNNGYYRNIIINDIDLNGKTDVIFGSYEESDANFSGNVWWFDNNGSKVWQRQVGREIKFGGKSIKNHYRIAHIYIRDLDSDGKNEIIQIGYHTDNFPVCLQICDLNGDLISEYWHVGQFDAISFLDMDNNGKNEILLAGQNNEYGNAVLAVLEFPYIKGCSPQTKGSEFFPDNLTSGAEKFYIRFPRTIFEKNSTRDQVSNVETGNHGLTIAVANLHPKSFWGVEEYGGMVFYDLDFNMSLVGEPALGDIYKRLLTNRFEIDIENMDMEKYKTILYWDGEKWTEEATVNRRWKKLKE